MNEFDIFCHARTLTSEFQTSYLRDACRGDTRLLRRLTVLLRNDARSIAILDRSPEHLLEELVDETDPEAMARESRKQVLDLLRTTEPHDRGTLGRLRQYAVHDVLGHGGFGVVLRAFDEKLRRMVALKVLSPLLADSEEARMAFQQEAQATVAVGHPSVVQVHAIEDEPLPFIVMEYIKGETLQERFSRQGPLPLCDAVELAIQVADGLAAAHAAGIVHRDIKPGNLLIEAATPLRIRITDFGLADVATSFAAPRKRFVAGTPSYMAPEQATGQNVDHRADLFSLGSVLYAMCTGIAPFTAKGTLSIMRRVVEETARPIAELVSGFPVLVSNVIERLHAKSPEDRYQSATEVSADLRRFQCLSQGGALDA